MPAIENHVSFRTELGAAELSATLGDSDRDRNAKEDAEHTAEQAVAERVRPERGGRRSSLQMSRFRRGSLRFKLSGRMLQPSLMGARSGLLLPSQLTRRHRRGS
jgi:hypothetical protein